jgi:hypothetical protein
MSYYSLPELNVSYIELKKTPFNHRECVNMIDLVLNKSLFEYLSSTYDCVKKNNLDIKKNNISLNSLSNIKNENKQLYGPSSFLTLVEIINMIKECTYIPKNKYTVSNFGRTPTDFISAFNVIFNRESNIFYKENWTNELNIEKYDYIQIQFQKI